MDEQLIQALAKTAEELEAAGYLDIAAKIDTAIFFLQGRPNCMNYTIASVYQMLLEAHQDKSKEVKSKMDLFQSSLEAEIEDAAKAVIENTFAILKGKDLLTKAAKIKTMNYLSNDLLKIREQE